MIAFIYKTKNKVIKFVLNLKSNVVIFNIVSIFFGEKFSLNNNMFEFNKIFSLLYKINSI